MVLSESIEHRIVQILRLGSPLDIYTIAQILFTSSGAPGEARPRKSQLHRTRRALRVLVRAEQARAVGPLPLYGAAGALRRAYTVMEPVGLDRDHRNAPAA
jgi:hypothetical protein